MKLICRKKLRQFVLWCLIGVLLVVLTGCDNTEKKISETEQEIGTIAFSDEAYLSTEELETLHSLQDKKEAAIASKDLDALLQVKEDWDAFKDPLQTRIQEANSAYAAIGNLSFMGEYQPTEDEDVQITALNQQKESAYASRSADELIAIRKEWDVLSNSIQSRIDEEERIKEERAQAILEEVIASSRKTAETITSLSFGMMEFSVTTQGHTIIFTYKYNTDVDKNYASSVLSWSFSQLDSFFQSIVDSLKSAGVSSPAMRYEVLSKDRSVLLSKTYQ